MALGMSSAKERLRRLTSKLSLLSLLAWIPWLWRRIGDVFNAKDLVDLVDRQVSPRALTTMLEFLSQYGWLLGIVWLTIVIVWPELKRKLWAAQEQTGSVDNVPALVSQLKPYANEYANLHLIIWSNSHRVLADKIASVFELGGWEVNYTKTAQEAYNPHYPRGIEVRVSNNQLGKLGQRVVQEIGGWDVWLNVEELKIAKDNPKWPRLMNRIHIIIGYPQS